MCVCVSSQLNRYKARQPNEQPNAALRHAYKAARSRKNHGKTKSRIFLVGRDGGIEVPPRTRLKGPGVSIMPEQHPRCYSYSSSYFQLERIVCWLKIWVCCLIVVVCSSQSVVCLLRQYFVKCWKFAKCFKAQTNTQSNFDYLLALGVSFINHVYFPCFYKLLFVRRKALFACLGSIL